MAIFCLELGPRKTSIYDSWRFQVGIKSKGGRGEGWEEQRKPHSVPADCSDWQQWGLKERGWKKASSWVSPSQDVRRGTLGVKNDRNHWDVQKRPCLGGSGGGSGRGGGLLSRVAWSLIKVQMPSGQFLQKESTVIAIYPSCLGAIHFQNTAYYTMKNRATW